MAIVVFIYFYTLDIMTIKIKFACLWEWNQELFGVMEVNKIYLIMIPSLSQSVCCLLVN